MRSIKHRFVRLQNEHPNLGDYVVFARAITGQGFTSDSISRAFTKMISRDKYDKKERKILLNHLCGLSDAGRHLKTLPKSQNQT